MDSFLLEAVSPFPIAPVAPDPERLCRCAQFARSRGLEMLFFLRLRTHCSGWSPSIDGYLAEAVQAYLSGLARSMRQEVMEQRVVASLAEHGMPACIVKGNQIARQLYEHANCRSSADTDVLIRAADLQAADNVLRGNGFVRTDSLPLRFCMARLHHAAYLCPAANAALDLHWDFGIPGTLGLDSGRIWAGVVQRPSGDYALTPEMTVVLLLVHHLRHAFRDFRILVDILWALHRYDRTIDWPRFATDLAAFGLTRTTAITLAQLGALWACSTPALRALRAVQELPTALPAGAPAYLVRYFLAHPDSPDPPQERTDRFMAKLVLDGPSAVLYSFVKVLLPRPRDIRALYPGTPRALLPVSYLRFAAERLRYWAAQ